MNGIKYPTSMLDQYKVKTVQVLTTINYGNAVLRLIFLRNFKKILTFKGSPGWLTSELPGLGLTASPWFSSGTQSWHILWFLFFRLKWKVCVPRWVGKYKSPYLGIINPLTPDILGVQSELYFNQRFHFYYLTHKQND